MNAFTELRRQAKEKRDKAIGQARADYADTLVKIATLEQDLLGRILQAQDDQRQHQFRAAHGSALHHVGCIGCPRSDRPWPSVATACH